MKKLLISIFALDNPTPTPTPTPEKKVQLRKMITTYKGVDSEGKSILTVSYGTNGFVSEIKSPNSYKKVFTYNDKNQLIKETETFQEAGKEVIAIKTYTYNEKGLLVSECLVLKNRYRLFNGTKLLKTIQQAIAC